MELSKMKKIENKIDNILGEAFNPRMMGNKKMTPGSIGKIDYTQNVKQMATHKKALQQALEGVADSGFTLINQIGDLGHSAHAAKIERLIREIAKVANDVIKKYG